MLDRCSPAGLRGQRLGGRLVGWMISLVGRPSDAAVGCEVLVLLGSWLHCADRPGATNRRRGGRRPRYRNGGPARGAHEVEETYSCGCVPLRRDQSTDFVLAGQLCLGQTSFAYLSASNCAATASDFVLGAHACCFGSTRSEISYSTSIDRSTPSSPCSMYCCTGLQTAKLYGWLWYC